MGRQPKFLIILAINNLLLKRVSGGPKNQMNKSNNNIMIRPGAVEFIQYLYESELFHIAFFTSMHENNAKICVKRLLNGRVSGISIKKNISIFAGSETTVYLDDNNFYLMKYKSELIDKVNHNLGKKMFDKSNTLIIDHLNQKEIVEEKINIHIPAYNNEKNDNWLYTLRCCLRNYINYLPEETISEYVREFISIMFDITSCSS
jgi:hypothetical protein